MARWLNGGSSRVVFGTTGVPLNADGTIITLVRPRALAGGSTIVSHGTDTNGGWLLQVNTSGVITWDKNGITTRTSTTMIKQGEWSVVMHKMDIGGTHRFYAMTTTGVWYYSDVADSGTMTTTGTPAVTFGQKTATDTGAPWDGDIACGAIYSGLMSEAEMLLKARAILTGRFEALAHPTATLITWMNGSGSIEHDYSGSGNAATSVNTAPLVFTFNPRNPLLPRWDVPAAAGVGTAVKDVILGGSGLIPWAR